MKFYQVTRSSSHNGYELSSEVAGTFAELESARACFCDTAQFLKESAIIELRNKGARLRLKNERWSVELCEVCADDIGCADSGDIESYGETMEFYDFCPVDFIED